MTKKIPILLKPKHTYDLIRLGNQNDGGYLIGFQTLSQTKCLLSFGIGLDISFEKDFYDKTKNKIYSYDKNDFKFYFKNEFLLSLNELRRFSLSNLINSIKKFIKVKKNEKILNFSKKLITYNSIKQIFDDIDIKENILVKIDIEGSEYRVLDCLLKNQNKIAGLIIEFHDIDLHMEKIENFIKKFDLVVSHIHANNFGISDAYGNPTVLEMTFEKSPKILNNFVEIPNIKDRKNNPKRKDFLNYFEK